MNTIIKEIGSLLMLYEETVSLYPTSYTMIEDTHFLMVAAKNTRMIAIYGTGPSFHDFEGERLVKDLKLCPLSHANRLMINKYFPYTLPSAFGRDVATFGVGDRLGQATPGHLRVISQSAVKPILAQQSKRELTLAGRTYQDVLDDVVFAVFQEGYTGGFGADGDHLKEAEDIAEALSLGYSMITLDCSEKMGHGVDSLSKLEVERNYGLMPTALREHWEKAYLEKSFLIGDQHIDFSRDELMRNALLYNEAIQFIIEIYQQLILPCGRAIDFEVSLDETESSTSLQGHLFVAEEISYAAVSITNLAPRFVGEFQKGIDYIGDLNDFDENINAHAQIADHYGYKLSIHSGSDKFSIYPSISRHTQQRLHVKTSGTSWLEAVALVAEVDPRLYRRIHQCALDNFEDAQAYYHVGADVQKVMDLNQVDDDQLIDYFSDPNARQLLHITYGFILGTPALKEPFFQLLYDHAPLYAERLQKHIGKHLSLLGVLHEGSCIHE